MGPNRVHCRDVGRKSIIPATQAMRIEHDRLPPHQRDGQHGFIELRNGGELGGGEFRLYLP